jgi:lipoprotein-anchoring transpeptidase ErfK/SrfK
VRRLWKTLVLTATAGVAASVVLAAPALGPSPPNSPLPARRALPAAPAPAFSVPTPRRLPSDEERSQFAQLRRVAVARSRPDRRAPVVARLSTRTPEGTSTIVPVLERRKRAGRLWIRVGLPVLPNNTTGWVGRSALGGYGTVTTRLVVDIQSLTAALLRNGRVVFEAPVGVGASRWPTPRGEFLVRSRLTRFESPFYGPLAFGTSARSAVLTDWPAGGFVGIHGTNRPELLPGRVSHGCIRMRNEDILRLGKLMPVGTPVTIR